MHAPPPPPPIPGAPPPDEAPHPLARFGSWPVVLATLLGSAIVGSAVSVGLARLLFGSSADIGPGAELLITPRELFLAILVSDAVLLGVVHYLLVRRGVVTWRDLGLGPGRSANPVLAGLGYGLLFMMAAGSVSLALAAFGVEQDQAQQFPIEGAGGMVRAGILVAGVVFAPFAEEVFFRGYIFRAMAERKGVVRGLVYSSGLFALVHGNVAAFLPLFAGAAVLAIAFRRTGTLWVPMVAHAFNNAAAFTILLLAG